MKLFKQELKQVLKTAPKEYLLLITISLVTRGILLLIPVFFSYSIELITSKDYNNAILLLIVLIVVALIYRLFEGFYQIAYYKLYNKLYCHYSSQALSKTFNNSLFSLSRFTTGGYANILITDVDVISGFYTNAVIRTFQLIEFLIIYSYFFSLNIYIFLSAILITLIMIFSAFKYGNVLQRVNEKRKASIDSMSASIYSFFNHIKEIKSYHIFDNIAKDDNEIIKTYTKNNARYNIYFNFSNQVFLYVFEFFRLVTVLYGLFLVKDGYFAVGTLLIIYNYYQKIIDNFTTVLQTNVDYRNLVVSLNRYNKLIEYSQEEEAGIKLDKNTLKGTIEFNDILYGFRDNPTLKDASMTIEENTITVLSGRDEAGENGIFDLLLKLNRQHEGTIKVDDIEIDKIEDESYYKILSCARRQSNLFETTIKNNFIIFNDNFNKVLEISKRIGLDPKIMKLEEGYDTILTDTTPVSQNTRMLLIIARCLLKDAKILLFDDIINGLDEEHEKLVMDYLKELKHDHTIVIVSNNPEIIQEADQVLDISDKKITSVI